MKIEADTELYETDKEVENLIDWVLLVGTDKGKQ